MILVVAIAIVVGVRDARERIIKNESCILLTGLGLAFQACRVLAPWLAESLPWWARLARALPGAGACVATGGAVLAAATALELAHRARHGARGMGLGDVKYLASWCVLLGPAAVAGGSVACLAGAVCALARRERTFALGPWLSAGEVAMLLFLAWRGM